MTGGARVQETAGQAYGDLNERLIATDWWDEQMLGEAEIPVHDAEILSVGGGIGSFALVDMLRIAGVPPERITVLGQFERPYEQYAFLCKNSQIPDPERLRSDSSACPDNIWGFPAYAIREAWQEKTFAPLWNVATEPILKDYYTPRSGSVFRSMDAEAERIGWKRMLRQGQVRMVRRRRAGGYFTILTPPPGTSPTKRIAFRSRMVHVAVGYPAVQFLPDLQRYREQYGDMRVINAYEPHERVYEELRREPGTVMVRGSGIVASRVLQRLIDDRDHHGAQTTILHLFRTYRDEPEGDPKYGSATRPAKDGWAYQAFNVTKASWGGQHKEKLLHLEGEERKRFLRYVGGGAHTPNRTDWKEHLARGKAQGFYRQQVGEVDEVVPAPDGQKVVSRVTDAQSRSFEVATDYVLDATGLVGSPREHRLLADLLDHGGAVENVLKRIECERSFEVRGTRSGEGRLYASGAATAGSTYGGVDSFLGLQYCALQILEDMHDAGVCPRIGLARSVSQWFKWIGDKAP